MLHTHINRNVVILLATTYILFFTPTPRSFAEDDNNTMKTVQWIQSFKAPNEMLTSTPSESLMYRCIGTECFLPEKMSFWKVNRSNLSSVDKYSFLSNSMESFAYDFQIRDRRLNIIRSQKQTLDRTLNSFDQMNPVSPDERYILFRYSPFNSELYELKTGKRLFDHLDDETIIGFDLDGNLYCSRPFVESMFLLRDIQTGKILKTYNTELLAEVISRKAEHQLNYQPYLIPQTTSDGRSTVFYLISDESDNGGFSEGLVLVCDNETNSAVAKSFANLLGCYPWRPLIRHDDKFIAIPNGSYGILVYDFEDRRFQNLRIPKDQNFPTYPIEFFAMRGFCFFPEDKLVLWKEFRGDSLSTSRQILLQHCLFDFKTSESIPLEDFATPEMLTRFYYYSVPHDIVITYENMSERNEVTGVNRVTNLTVGKYVFWDFKTKKRIFETEAKYYANIVVSPDGNHVYLTSTERSFGEYQGVTRMLLPVDVFEIR